MTADPGTAAHGTPWRAGGTLTLPAIPAAARCARAFTRHTLHRWQLAHLAEAAELLVSELAANAIQATGPAGQDAPAGEVALIQIRLALADSLVLGVWDRDPTPPTPRIPDPDPDTDSGRGLLLVAHLSTRWGHRHPETGGKIVWCELDTTWPTTPSGLPLRTPAAVPTQRAETAGDAVVLHRVDRDGQRSTRSPCPDRWRRFATGPGLPSVDVERGSIASGDPSALTGQAVARVWRSVIIDSCRCC